MLNDALTRLIAGIVMLIVGLILIYIGGNWLWDGWQRWGAVNALNDGRRNVFLGRERIAQENLARASRYRSHPTTAVANIDPLNAEAGGQLSQLARSVRSHGGLIRLTQDYVKVVQNETVTLNGSGSNIDALRLIGDYRNHLGGSVPAMPSQRANDPVDPGLWRLLLEHRLQAAWRSADHSALHEAGGQLALLYPKHPAAPFARLLHAATASPLVEGLASNLSSKAAKENAVLTAAVLRAASLIQPDNSSVLQGLIPSSQRTGVELISTMIAAKAPAEDLVREAVKIKNDNILRTVTSYCLEIDRLDLIRQLGRHGSEEFQRMAAIIIAQRELDFQTLSDLDIDYQGISPQAMLLHNYDGWLSFHLGDPFGRVPSAPITISLDGQIIPDDQVQRLGSLHRVPLTRFGRMGLELRIGDTVLFTREVIR